VRYFTGMEEHSKIDLISKVGTISNNGVIKDEDQAYINESNLNLRSSSLNIIKEKSTKELIADLADIFVESIVWELYNG